MKISLVILQYGNSNFTTNAIESIFEGTVVPDEVIVVDNASNPKDTEWMMRDNRIKPVYLSKNFGYIGGTNIGWRLAQGEYIILCNNDIALAKNCVENIVTAMKIQTEFAWLSACYCAGPWYNSAVEFPADVKSNLDQSFGHNRESMNKWAEEKFSRKCLVDHSYPTEATVVCVRKSMSDEIGQFNKDLFYNHTHDYYYRVTKAGYLMGVCKSAVFWHNDTHPTLSTQRDFVVRQEQQKSDRLMDSLYGPNWRNV